MRRTAYIYSNHLSGGYYICDHEQTYDECHCEQCGDSDWLEYVIKSEKDIEDFILNETTDYCCECQKHLEADSYDVCPYCGSQNISWRGSVTSIEYIMEFVEKLKQWLKEK